MPAPGRNDDRQDPTAAAERGRIDPVYCLAGSERYLVDRCLAAIRKAVLEPRTAGFNHDVFDLRETGINAVLTAARTMPMMAARRLVVAKGIDAVKAGDLDPLGPYAADPNPAACLVLLGEKVDTRFRAFQALRKAGYLHDFPGLRDRELAGFVVREAAGRNTAIDQDAAAALGELAGPDLGRLAQAVEQLALYAGAGQRIRLADVEALIPETRARGIFELTKAIGSGDREGALRLLTNMLRNREPALRIQFMLIRQLRQIWRAKELAAASAPRMEIAAKVGISPYFLDDVLVPARRMSARALRRGHLRLYQADRTLKSSRVDPDLVLSRLVQSLAEDAR